MYIACILHVYCMYIACILHVYCMYVACILHVYCMYIACMLHVCCMYVACMYDAWNACMLKLKLVEPVTSGVQERGGMHSAVQKCCAIHAS